MTFNPDCTPGWTEPARQSGYIACCGCGWTDGVYESKSQAKKAQRAHRFPVQPEEPEEPGQPAPGPECKCCASGGLTTLAVIGPELLKQCCEPCLAAMMGSAAGHPHPIATAS